MLGQKQICYQIVKTLSYKMDEDQDGCVEMIMMDYNDWWWWWIMMDNDDECHVGLGGWWIMVINDDDDG